MKKLVQQNNSIKLSQKVNKIREKVGEESEMKTVPLFVAETDLFWR